MHLYLLSLVEERFQGSKLGGEWEPRAPLNSPVAPSNFCREPKDVLISIRTDSMQTFEDVIGLPGNNSISSTAFRIELDIQNILLSKVKCFFEYFLKLHLYPCNSVSASGSF